MSLSANWVRAVNGIGPRSDPLEFVWRVNSRAEGITCVSTYGALESLNSVNRQGQHTSTASRPVPEGLGTGRDWSCGRSDMTP